MLWWVYDAALHCSEWQVTVGKKTLDLKVVDGDEPASHLAELVGNRPPSTAQTALQNYR
jgi:hypothetical protein